MPNISEERISDLQKACFIKARTVKAFFEGVDGAGRDGQITKNTFRSALEDLELHWPAVDSDKIYS